MVNNWSNCSASSRLRTQFHTPVPVVSVSTISGNGRPEGSSAGCGSQAKRAFASVCMRIAGGVPQTPGETSGCGPRRSSADGGGCASPSGGGPIRKTSVAVRPCVALAMLPITTVWDRSRAAFSASEACQAMRVTAAGASAAFGGEAWQVRYGGPPGVTGSVKMSSQVSFTGGPPGSPAASRWTIWRIGGSPGFSPCVSISSIWPGWKLQPEPATHIEVAPAARHCSL